MWANETKTFPLVPGNEQPEPGSLGTGSPGVPGAEEQRAVRAHCPGPLQLLGSPSRLGVRCSSDCPSCLAKASGPQGCFPWREGTGRDGMGWDSHLLLPTPEGCLFSVQCCVAAETFSASSVTLPYAKFVKSCSHFFFSL